MSGLTVKNAVDYARKIYNGENGTQRPKMPYVFSEEASDGDMVWQGDLGIGIVSGGPPSGYVRVEKALKCLVPGKDHTIGARHCLSSCNGVEMWIPQNWDETSLDGPYIKLSKVTTITHPVHGDVIIPACFNEIQIVYQREWDLELARERRAKD